MYADQDITSIFAQCREHYNSAAIEEAENEGGDQHQHHQQNDENSNNGNESQGGDGGSSSSSIERSVGSLDASSGGYEASSSSSSSQTPNIANGRSGSKQMKNFDKKRNLNNSSNGNRGFDKHNRRRSGSLEAALADVLAPAQGSAAPPTKSVSFTGNVKPPSSYNNRRKHSRGRQDQADHQDEPACKASELDTKERAARKSDPNDADLPDSERLIMRREQALAQHQLLQGNEMTIEQAMTLCRQPRILTLSSEPFVVVHVNASFTMLSGIDNHVISGQPVETVFFYSQPSATSGKKDGCSGNETDSKSSSSSTTAVISNWITNSHLCNDRVVDVVVHERYGNQVGISRDEDMLSSRLQGTRRCRLMISKVCSFERSSSSSSGSSTSGSGGGSGCGSGLSSREGSNAELSSEEDAGDAGIAPDSTTSASEDTVTDRQSDESGSEPPLQKTTTHYLLQLYPCQLLVGPRSATKTAARGDNSHGMRHGKSGGGDQNMYVIG